MLSLANGGIAGKEAFAAFVRFRDEGGSLILPPYAGFNHSPRGAAYFFVAGGEAIAPVATTHSFVAPFGAAIVEIELRPWGSNERPQLALEPRLVREGLQSNAARANLGIHRIPVSGDTSAVTLSLANGGVGEKKAFVASVGFLDHTGSLIQPPYTGFARSTEISAYFYVEGGSADAPTLTTHNFTPPANAVIMEIILRSWRFRGQAQLTNEPVTALRRTIETQPPAPQAAQQRHGAGALTASLETPPIGSQITRSVDSEEIRLVGIVGDELRNAWRARILDTTLPFDGYDRDWDRVRPTHLVIEADQLPQRFGWNHTLTLCDPAATVEMAVMLQKARAAGIVTVLISPTESHRFPLLSRIADLFDLTLKSEVATIEQFTLNRQRSKA